MTTNYDRVFLRGELKWAKVFGDPRPNYDGDAREWTFDLYAEDFSEIEEAGLGDRIKDKGDGRFIHLRQREFKSDGEKADHIKVVDGLNKPWPHDVLLGNGTVADVKVSIADFGRGKKKGMYPSAIRVLDHKAYEAVDFDELPKDDKYRPRDTFAEDFGVEAAPAEPDKKPSKKKVPVEDLDDDMPI